MKRVAFLLAAAFLFVTGCSIHEADQPTSPELTGDEFYATFESYSDPETRVYVDEDVKILWNADDRVSIFNKISYNQEYRFTGKEGANAGGFKKVDADEFVTGAQLSYVAAVYPYLEDTEINNKNVMTVTMPAEQHYKAGSFGPGANTMVATAEDNVLLFKNLGGYLVLKFYGENVNVASVKLEGNADEILSGAGTFKPAVGVIPSVSMSATGGKSITLVCDEPVTLGTTKEEATSFWLVVPPTEFKTGFTLTVTDTDGNTFVKKTDKDLTINRNGVLRISAIEVEIAVPLTGNIQFADEAVKRICVENWDTNGDGELSYEEAAAVTRLGNAFFLNDDVEFFEEFRFFVGIETMGSQSMGGTVTNSITLCSNLKKISLPSTLKSLGMGSIDGCQNLEEIEIPDEIGTNNIWGNPFSACPNLVAFIDSQGNRSRFFYRKNQDSYMSPATLISVATGGLSSLSISAKTVGRNVSRLGEGVFQGCKLESLNIESGPLLYIYKNAFAGTPNTAIYLNPGEDWDDTNLRSISECAFASSGIPYFSIPETVSSLGKSCFYNCASLSSLTLNSTITKLPEELCYKCTALNVIHIPASVTSIGNNAFSDCTAMTRVQLWSTTPPTLEGTPFDNTPCTFYVPKEALSTYKNHPQWSSYASRIEAGYY